MFINKITNLACPIDGELLITQEKQLVCKNGHSFDIARQGYINLLPVQHKRSKEPGDSKEMVTVRTEFLNTDLYEPIAKKITEINQNIISEHDDSDLCILDAGCGEGYYSNYILNMLSIRPGQHKLGFIGLDISKYAILAAAKRNKLITWIVGTNRKPPLINNSVDIINCVFGFQNFEGFIKIMKRGGYIVLVEPGPEHLKELRNIIYSELKKVDPSERSSVKQNGFSLVASEQLHFTTGEINNDLIQKLLLMTPHFFRANLAGREAVNKLTKLNLTVDIVFKVLQKNIS
jgi:23S rRNA (guanine745-N1)-methyltransferase